MGEPINAMQRVLSEFVTDLDTPRPQPPVPYICKVLIEFHSDDKAKYFEPTLVSVMPLHYDPRSRANELKREFARNFIQRIDGAEDAKAEALSKIEAKIRGCYKELELSMGRENLLKIILVDGCFMVELLMSYDSSTSTTFVGSRAASVPFITLQKDLLKFENQLPFFVLKALASLVTTSQMGEPSNAMQRVLSEFVTDLDTPRLQPPVPYIYKVPTEFRSDSNAKYFEPTLVSVGPLHYDPPSPANELKREFARNFIQRVGGAVDAIAEALSKIEVKIRGCYKEQELSMGRENLLKIILVDGCFIVELLMSYDSSTSTTFVGSTAASVPFITLQKDLLKFENQLPFFVLKALASLVTTSQSDNMNQGSLVDMALDFLNISKPEFTIDVEPMHLLEVVLQASFYKVESDITIVEMEETSNAMQRVLSEFARDRFRDSATAFQQNFAATTMQNTSNQGPVHHDPHSLAHELKKEFARQVIHRIDGGADAITEALSNMEAKFRGCYKEVELRMGRDDF